MASIVVARNILEAVKGEPFRGLMEAETTTKHLTRPGSDTRPKVGLARELLEAAAPSGAIVRASKNGLADQAIISAADEDSERRRRGSARQLPELGRARLGRPEGGVVRAKLGRADRDLRALLA
jgi:hypothetical protein